MKISILRTISVGYLLLPNILFALGWFRIQFSIPLIIGFFYLFYLQFKDENLTEISTLPLKDLIILAFAAIFWTFCTGTSGLSFQIADYWAHNAKFYDLYKNSWPIYFAEKDQYACYYFGYFLVPAFISKVIGFLSPSTLFLWTCIGYWLGLLWIYSLLYKKKRLILAFLFMGGIGHLVKVLFYQFTDYQFHIAPFYTEIWSIFDQSLWVTNQVIPIILISSIFIHDAFIKGHFEDSFFPITLGFLWAIFPSIIFVILFGVLFSRKYFSNPKLLFTNPAMLRIILPGLVFLPTFIYFQSSDSFPISGFIWQFDPVSEIMMEYLVGTILDIILFFLLTQYFKNKVSIIPSWFINIVFMVFLLMSTFRIGRWNDWFIRGYIPLMFMISIPLIRHIYELWESGRWQKKFYFNILIFILSLNFIIPIGHIIRSLRTNVIANLVLKSRPHFTPLPYDTYPNTYVAVTHHSSDGELESKQYLGKKFSFYEKFLSREVD